MNVIPFPKAIHHPNTVMIVFCNADVAYAAMLASSWFQELAGTANLSWSKKHMIIRVSSHLAPMIHWCNDRRGRSHGFECEQIWNGAQRDC